MTTNDLYNSEERSGDQHARERISIGCLSTAGGSIARGWADTDGKGGTCKADLSPF